MNRTYSPLILIAALAMFGGNSMAVQAVHPSDREIPATLLTPASVRTQAADAPAPSPTVRPVIPFGELGSFSAHMWTYRSFWWTPGAGAPEGVKDLKSDALVVGTKGRVKFEKTGQYTFTFQYKNGPIKLTILGVDVCDLDGKVVAHDYHKGETGTYNTNNKYTLSIPKEGVYLLRYFIDRWENQNNRRAHVKPLPAASNGIIEISPALTTNTVVPVYDLKGEEQERYEQAQPKTATETAVAGAATLTFNSLMLPSSNKSLEWNDKSWHDIATIPSAVEKFGLKQEQVKQLEHNVFVEHSGLLTAEFQYDGGNNSLNPVGVELVDIKTDKVVASDYHKGNTGNTFSNNIYTFRVENPGNYKLRCLVSNSEPINSKGFIQVTLRDVDLLHLKKGAHYGVNFNEQDISTHGSRELKGVTITPQYGNAVKLENSNHRQVYWDFTGNPIKVIAGTNFAISTNYSGYAMQGFFYMDKNQNSRFDVEKIEDAELIATTGGQDSNKKWKKKSSDGVVSDYSGRPADAGQNFNFTLTAPTTPGLYRMRYKVDWASLEPGGTTDPGNELKKNGGNVVDFYIEVIDPVKTQVKNGTFSYNVSTFEGTNGKYATVHLPFAVQLPEGLTAHKLAMSDDKTEVSFPTLTERVIPANTAVFLSSENAGQFTLSSTFTTATLQTGLQGTNVSLPNSERKQDMKYFCLSSNADKLMLFMKPNDNVAIPANRAFILLPKAEGAANTLRIMLPELKPTSIRDLQQQLNNSAATEATYNLSGQRINGEAHGLVIRNGKKVWLP